MASDTKSNSTERNWSMHHGKSDMIFSLILCPWQTGRNSNDCMRNLRCNTAADIYSSDRQHEVFRLVFDGLYPCKETVTEVMNSIDGQPKRILDLGNSLANSLKFSSSNHL